MDQTINGNGNTQVGRDYTHNETHNTHYSTPQPEIAQYQKTEVNQIPPDGYVAKHSSYFFIVGLVISVIQYFDGFVSLLNAFGIHITSGFQFNISAWFAVGVLFFFALIDKLRTVELKNLKHGHWIRKWGTLFVKQQDDSIKVYNITAKCPVPGCAGTLRLDKPAISPNQEGIGMAGICSDWSQHHMFEFNDKTFQGSRIAKLTPIVTTKK